jgi:NADP-dependent 3-hydroxy acid dehydrogenase YdfG
MSKVILITGASTGIGEACAQAAVQSGHKVALAARSVDKLSSLVEQLGEDNALAITCDVTSFEDQQAMVTATLAKFGRIDVAFANAGIGATDAGTEGGDPENWRDMILTNVLGAAITAKVTIPELKKNEGHLLLTGSRAGRSILKGSIYGATKWAIAGYVQNLREELSGTGVRVTNIAPGMVDTPFFDSAKPQALRVEDIANAFIYAISQPSHVEIGEVLIVPTPPKAE